MVHAALHIQLVINCSIKILHECQINYCRFKNNIQFESAAFNFIIVTTLTLSLEPSKKYFACERRLAFGKANMCFLYLLDHVTHVIFHFNALAFMGKTSRAKIAASYYALYKKREGNTVNPNVFF